MKTLSNHTLIYDNDCPMCNMYSRGFTKCGMLDEDGREAFSEISEKTKSMLDFHRAKNEIALINHDQNKVIYGIDSLLLIIGNLFPVLAKIAKLPPFYWFFIKLYKFVSYNRKQIVPSPKDYSDQSCVPDFSLKYRIFYIVLVLFFSAYVLAHFNAKMFPSFNRHFELKFFICIMQIIWQSVFLGWFMKGKFWDYIGNMMTVSLMGTLFLIPPLFFNFSENFYFAYFGFVVFIMFLEHIRRCRILKIGFLPTLSWMLFRITFGLVLMYIVSQSFIL